MFRDVNLKISLPDTLKMNWLNFLFGKALCWEIIFGECQVRVMFLSMQHRDFHPYALQHMSPENIYSQPMSSISAFHSIFHFQPSTPIWLAVQSPPCCSFLWDFIGKMIIYIAHESSMPITAQVEISSPTCHESKSQGTWRLGGWSLMILQSTNGILGEKKHRPCSAANYTPEKQKTATLQGITNISHLGKKENHL